MASAGQFVLQCTGSRSRIVLPVGRFVQYMVRNHRFTVTIDSILANSSTQNAFLSPVHAMFCHDCPLVMKPASTLWRLLPIQTWTDSLSVDMLLSAVFALVVTQQCPEVLAGLTNYPVCTLPLLLFSVSCNWQEVSYKIHTYTVHILGLGH
jgi:hypothetical protein